MNRKTCPFLLTLLLAITLAAPAAAGTLTLREALVLGLAENYDLRIADLDVERAQAGVTGEEGRFDLVAELGINASRSELPTDSTLIDSDVTKTSRVQAEAALSKHFATGLQTRLSLTGTRSDTDSLADRLEPSYRTALVLDLTLPLLKDRGTDVNTANLQIATTQQQQAAHGYLASAQQLAAEIETAYFDLAQVEAEYRYAILARDLATELLAGNQRKLDTGLIPVTEVNEAKSAVAGREQNVLLYRQRITQRRNRLLELIDQGETSLPPDWQVSLPETVGTIKLDLEQAISTGLLQRPDLQQARLELVARKVALVYAQNQQLPRLDLEASLSVNGLSGESESPSYYSGDWQDAFDKEGSSWYAGIRFSMPLQNRNAQALSRDAAAQDRQSLYRLRRAEIATETAIRSALATVELGMERVNVARSSSELAQATLDQENRRLEEGLSDTFRILSFQNALVSAKVSEVAAITDYYRAQASLFQAMGVNLERYNIVAALPHQGAMP